MINKTNHQSNKDFILNLISDKYVKIIQLEIDNLVLKKEFDDLSKHYTDVVSKNLDQYRQLERQAAYIQQLQHYISYLTPYTNHATEHWTNEEPTRR